MKKTVLLIIALFSGYAQAQRYEARNINLPDSREVYFGIGNEGGGGGNALNGKMIENYFVDITTTPAYQHVVNPLFIRFENRYTENNNKFLFGAMRFRFKELAWYFIPARHKELTKDVTGLPFPSDQLAVQTDAGEVWIDEDMFNQKTKEEQGKLIIHEGVLRIANYMGSKGSLFPCSQESIMKRTRLTTRFIVDPRALGLSEKQYEDALAGLGWYGNYQCNSRFPEL